MSATRLLTYFLYLILVTHGTHTLAQAPPEEDSRCGPLRPPGQYGPLDFRTDRDKIGVVVNNHFLPEVENLLRGHSSITPGGDIDFTLRAIPNHPNALMSMMLLGEKEKSDQPVGSRYTVECWFERAIRFRPDDYVARMIYTSFLTKKNRKADALRQLDVILANAKDNPFTYNNVGLLYFDLGEYPQALAQAHKSIELGLDRPALRDKLTAVGKWAEPIVATPEKTAAEPASSPTSAAAKP
jgi:tetratricopeptide (TPR) repeat protein